MFVDDPDKKKALADIYRTYATPYLDRLKPDYGDERDRQRPRVTDSAKYLNEHMHQVPVLLIPCIVGRADNLPGGQSAGFWGSLLPAAWSFMLALRSRGLGSAWTTLHLVGDGEQRGVRIAVSSRLDLSINDLCRVVWSSGLAARYGRDGVRSGTAM